MANENKKGLRVPADRLIKKKVAIVGFTDHREQAFLLPREEWEVWGLNELHRQHDPALFDRWFEVHNRKDLDTDAQHIEALSKFDIPVYMQDSYPDIPASVPFPRDAIIKHFGVDYFTSSIAWEIAYAVMLGAEAIHVYGVDMAQDTEYAEQRPCCEFWMGIAKGRGIEVYVPPTSDLTKTIGQYGFGDTGGDTFTLKLREREAWLHRQDNDFLAQIRGIDGQYPEIKGKLEAEFREKMGKLQSEFDSKSASLDQEYRTKREHLLAQRNQVFGAILDVQFMLRSWAMPTSRNREFSPDRSQDPRTGIGKQAKPEPKDAAAAIATDDYGINPAARVETVAA